MQTEVKRLMDGWKRGGGSCCAQALCGGGSCCAQACREWRTLCCSLGGGARPSVQEDADLDLREGSQPGASARVVQRDLAPHSDCSPSASSVYIHARSGLANGGPLIADLLNYLATPCMEQPCMLNDLATPARMQDARGQRRRWWCRGARKEAASVHGSCTWQSSFPRTQLPFVLSASAARGTSLCAGGGTMPPSDTATAREPSDGERPLDCCPAVQIQLCHPVPQGIEKPLDMAFVP
jgi:hypothetical protein